MRKHKWSLFLANFEDKATLDFWHSWNTGRRIVGDAVSGLTVSIPDAVSRGSALEHDWGSLCCILGQNTLLSQCLSPPRSINGNCQIVGESCQKMLGGYLRWTNNPSRLRNNTPSRSVELNLNRIGQRGSFPSLILNVIAFNYTSLASKMSG